MAQVDGCTDPVCGWIGTCCVQCDCKALYDQWLLHWREDSAHEVGKMTVPFNTTELNMGVFLNLVYMYVCLSWAKVTIHMLKRRDKHSGGEGAEISNLHKIA